MKRIGREVGGLAQLVTRFGNEITQVVQDIHGSVANPFGLRGQEYTPAPMVYNLVRYRNHSCKGHEGTAPGCRLAACHWAGGSSARRNGFVDYT